jgi:hypothetical protein
VGEEAGGLRVLLESLERADGRLGVAATDVDLRDLALVPSLGVDAEEALVVARVAEELLRLAEHPVRLVGLGGGDQVAAREKELGRRRVATARRERRRGLERPPLLRGELRRQKRRRLADAVPQPPVEPRRLPRIGLEPAFRRARQVSRPLEQLRRLVLPFTNSYRINPSL